MLDVVVGTDCGDELGGEVAGLARMRDIHLDDCELVAAEAGHQVALAQIVFEPLSDHAQELVADRMPERVVDALEMVEVEAEHRNLVVAVGKVQCLLELLAEQDSVWQIGERVMARHVEDSFLGALPVGDILECRDPAAAFHRLRDDADLAIKLIDDPLHRLARTRFVEQFGEEIFRVAFPASGCLQLPEDLEQRSSLELHAGAAHHRHVALVEELDAAFRIVHAQALRHVFERSIEQHLLPAQRALGLAIHRGAG